MTQDAHDQLMGSTVPGAKFDAVGAIVIGTIVDLDVTQQRDYKTRDLKTWPSGDPMMQIVITLQTDERDATIEGDDGKRRFYVDGKNKREQLQDAVRRSGARLNVGGRMAIRWTGEGPAENGLNPPKLWAFEYQAPVNNAVNSMLDGPAPGQAAAATPAAPSAPAEPAPSMLGSVL